MFEMGETGRKISAARKAKNMTQMELADQMGISFQAVSNWERGSSMPDISKLPELAEILGVSIDQLLGEEAPLVKAAADNRMEEFLEAKAGRKQAWAKFQKAIPWTVEQLRAGAPFPEWDGWEKIDK